MEVELEHVPERDHADAEARALSVVNGAALGLLGMDVYRQPSVLNCIVLAVMVLATVLTVFRER